MINKTIVGHQGDPTHRWMLVGVTACAAVIAVSAAFTMENNNPQVVCKNVVTYKSGDVIPKIDFSEARQFVIGLAGCWVDKETNVKIDSAAVLYFAPDGNLWSGVKVKRS